MNFNSAAFVLFVAIVALLYAALQAAGRHRLQNRTLLIASYVFYGAWDHRFLFLILLSTALDYTAGLGIVGRRPTKRVTAAMAVLLLAASVLLCAPIDWAGISHSLLPDSAWEGGWIERPTYQGPLVPDASWRIFFGALAATAAVRARSEIRRTSRTAAARKSHRLLAESIPDCESPSRPTEPLPRPVSRTRGRVARRRTCVHRLK